MVNLVTPKAGTEQELLFSKPASLTIEVGLLKYRVLLQRKKYFQYQNSWSKLVQIPWTGRNGKLKHFQFYFIIFSSSLYICLGRPL
jgi:hypothetical protein